MKKTVTLMSIVLMEGCTLNIAFKNEPHGHMSEPMPPKGNITLSENPPKVDNVQEIITDRQGQNSNEPIRVMRVPTVRRPIFIMPPIPAPPRLKTITEKDRDNKDLVIDELTDYAIALKKQYLKVKDSLEEAYEDYRDELE